MARDLTDILPDDEFETAFPGCALTHVLTIAGRDQLEITLEALQAIRSSGADLEALHLDKRGGVWEHRLRLTGLRPHHARLLCNRLAALPGVLRASVEHQFSRPIPSLA